jgi:hypothetical protein
VKGEPRRCSNSQRREPVSPTEAGGTALFPVVPIHQFKFEGMLNRARLLRRRIDELGSPSGAVIEAHVRDRLSWRPTDDLPPAQSQLADEILALLDDPRLSPNRPRSLSVHSLAPVTRYRLKIDLQVASRTHR